MTEPIYKALSYLEKLYTPLTRPPLLLGGPWLLQLRPAAAPEGEGRAWSGRRGFLPSGSLLGAGPPVTDRGAVPHPAQGVCGPASCSRQLGDCNLSLTFRTACFKVNFQSQPRCSQHFVTKTNRAGGGGGGERIENEGINTGHMDSLQEGLCPLRFPEGLFYKN